MQLRVVSLDKKFSAFQETWKPKIVGELNDFHVKVVKIEGEFVWHHHEVEDELFFVVDGQLEMRYRDGDREVRATVAPGEFIVVPHGVEHCPVARAGTKIMLLEPKSTVNTGESESDRTATPVWI